MSEALDRLEVAADGLVTVADRISVLIGQLKDNQRDPADEARLTAATTKVEGAVDLLVGLAGPVPPPPVSGGNEPADAASGATGEAALGRNLAIKRGQ